MNFRSRLIIFFSLFVSIAHSQQLLTGTIKDGKWLPIEAASGKVKNTVIATIADAKGEFRIPTPKELLFTSQTTSSGYAPSEVLIAEIKDSVLNIVLIDHNLDRQKVRK